MWRSLAEPKWSAVGSDPKRSVCAMPSAHRAAVNGWRCCRRRALRQRRRKTAKLWRLDGALERTIDVATLPVVSPRCPTACTLWSAPPSTSSCTTSTGRSSTPSRGTSSMYEVAVTGDGQHIISGSGDSRVKVWSVATKSLVGDCIGHNSAVLAVAVMPDGKRILSGSNDKTVRRWLLDGTQTDTFRLHTASVRALVALARQPARALRPRTTTPSSSSTPTTAPSCAPSSITRPGALPRAAARRPPLRQRLGRPHRLHRRARPRAAARNLVRPNEPNAYTSPTKK